MCMSMVSWAIVQKAKDIGQDMIKSTRGLGYRKHCGWYKCIGLINTLCILQLSFIISSQDLLGKEKVKVSPLSGS